MVELAFLLPLPLIIGLAITAATVAVLVAGFFRRRRRREFPAYGWLGIVALAGAELMLFRGVEPVATYFTPVAWSAYILIADAAVLALTNRSRLHDAPIILARMGLLSIPLWVIFEAYNFRLQNWEYAGMPSSLVAEIAGYVWSFATIPRAAENAMMICGAAFLIVPLVIPRHVAAYLFVLVWLGFILLLDPMNRRLRLPSFLGDISDGFARRFYGFLASGWICGWLWEFWNYWAHAKWRYTFPMFQQTKVFEMPAPGYLGFIPFALDCFAMYVTAAWLAGWLKRVK
jgi:hypothetical protein